MFMVPLFCVIQTLQIQIFEDKIWCTIIAGDVSTPQVIL